MLIPVDLEGWLHRKYEVLEQRARAPIEAARLRAQAMLTAAKLRGLTDKEIAEIEAEARKYAAREAARARVAAAETFAQSRLGAAERAARTQELIGGWEWGPGGVRERQVRLQERGAELLEDYLQGLYGGEGGADEVAEILRRRKKRRSTATPVLEEYLYE